MKQYLYTLCFFLLFIILSCTSGVEKEVQKIENPTVRVLRIRQYAFNQRYNLAEKLYTQLKADYPENEALQIETDYEIAFLYVKRKQYEEAKTQFETIINRYETDANSAALPQWTYYLSQKILTDVVLVELAKPPVGQIFIPKRWRNPPEDNNAQPISSS